jgi:hypothetical protein
MPKYLILNNADDATQAKARQAGPDQVKAAMAEWIAWKEEADKSVSFEWGMPLLRTARVTADGVTDSDTPVSGYAMIEADSKEAVLEVLHNHPHLKQPGNSIDVLEMVSMPGMDAA